MIKEYEKDDAVSPVVGVMLMLVVTIIIAAVVSGFAGGLVSSTEKAPQASIAVSTGTVDGNFDIKFEHQGGDPIRTKDCEFITFLTLPNGTVVKHVQTPTSSVARSEKPQIAMTHYTYSRGPHLTDPQKYAYPCNPATSVTVNGWVISGYQDVGDNYAWFGQAVWLPGDVARTFNNGYTANFVGLVKDPLNPTDEEFALLGECVQRNCNLEIKLLHVPSGKYILDKTITLQG
ncbi:MAG TPA: type IV pilin N-terminal domain-containing protein [Methanoregulaceae archaeon]|nr:MAG: type IV pilin N-terminal domain-containing protein [Methanolinea sp.]HON81219.1 type IV pilin N-terminal domain-containing protein [Methanoregulaceae archaeon]HPD10176.1 type IV pilin N-terminal domain-containing protein [Methanoregulaceae archaeon]HRT15181.1 type IV pilin N-terminal domain-containing protein [Methanoregulaceae archaeon]HRU30702.1 type IV pilin N-terminal domain-containing protein [Methanoregulaceae archaeon]